MSKIRKFSKINLDLKHVRSRKEKDWRCHTAYKN